MTSDALRALRDAAARLTADGPWTVTRLAEIVNGDESTVGEVRSVEHGRAIATMVNEARNLLSGNPTPTLTSAEFREAVEVFTIRSRWVLNPADPTLLVNRQDDVVGRFTRAQHVTDLVTLMDAACEAST